MSAHDYETLYRIPIGMYIYCLCSKRKSAFILDSRSISLYIHHIHAKIMQAGRQASRYRQVGREPGGYVSSSHKQTECV